MLLPMRAQRLSASTDETQLFASVTILMRSCAQRLSASTDETLLRIGCCVPRREVLNAFRHQRMKHTCLSSLPPSSSCCAQRLSASTDETPGCRRGTLDAVRVLNAFRHQRMKHINLPIQSIIDVRCSTPFGING